MFRQSLFWAFALALVSTALSQGVDGSLFGDGPAVQAAREVSEKTNDDIKAINEATGSNITPPEDQTGLMRLFFTATPSPSPSPTPSVTPSSSVTPTPSTSPTPSVTPSTSVTPSSTSAPTPSKSPSPTPFKGRTSVQIIPDPVTLPLGGTEDEPNELIIEIDEDEPVEEGDIVTVDSVSVQAQNEHGSELNTTTGRFLMPGDSTFLDTTSRQACGVYLAFAGYGSFAVPGYGSLMNQCRYVEVNIGPFNVRLTRVNGRLAIAMTTYSICMSPNCGGGIILPFTKYIGVGSTPTPVPSN